MLTKLRAFGKNEDGAATIEFIAVFFGFIAVLTFIIETSIYLFFMASAEKAAEAGVRMAVVSWPVVGEGSLQAPIPVNAPKGDYGQSCDSDVGGDSPCLSYGTFRCGRGEVAECPLDSTSAGRSFDRILSEMQRYNANIARNNVTIVYQDVGIGFAGGPTVPMVTVTVGGLGMQTGVFGLLLGDAASSLGLLPARSASMTGESLGQ